MHASRGHTARLIIVVLGALLLLTACGSGSSPTAAGQPSGESVTIKHALGEAVITKRPERVVTLGMGSAETAIALGTVPVGIEEYKWGSDSSGYLPWIREELTKRGAPLPKQFTGGTELDINAILALKPDLILAPWSGITQDQYNLLKDIAPTVAYPKLPWTITWEEQMQTIGTALGESAEAQQLIEGVKKQFADVAAAHPQYADIDFSFIYNSGPGTLGVFMPDEQRVAMVRGLGLTVDPVVNTMTETEGTDSAVIGLENADLLKNSDLIFTFYSTEDNRKEIEAQPLYQQIPAIARGSVVAPTDQSFVTGSSIINPLTVPWTLQRYVPLIDAAIAKLK